MSGWLDKKRPTRYMVEQQIKHVSTLVARQLNIDLDRMMSYERSDPVLLRGRQCTMWLCRFGLELRWSEIRRAVKRDHATVIHSVRKFGVIMTEDTQWRLFAEGCLRAVESGGYLIKGDTIRTVIPQMQRPEARKEIVKVLANTEIKPIDTFAEVAFNERDGDRGTSRQKLVDQNERFAEAMRKALQN